MNNLETYYLLYFGVFGFLCVLMGIVIRSINDRVEAYLTMRRHRLVYPSLVRSNTSSRCKGPHDWDRSVLALTGLSAGTYTICQACGFVAGSPEDLQLNGPGLEVFRNGIKIRDEREAAWDAAFKKKQDETLKIMNRLIQANIYKLSGDTNSNIEVLQQFFRQSNIELDSLYATLNVNSKNETNGDG